MRTDCDKLLSWASADDPFVIDQVVGGHFGKLVNNVISGWSPKQLFDHVGGMFGGIDDAALCTLSNFSSFCPTLARVLPSKLIERARDVPELAADLYKRFGGIDDVSLREYVKRERARRPKKGLSGPKSGPKKDYDLDRWADDGGRVFESKLRSVLSLMG